jgi:ABC-type Fe3+/spermidine/putrescine transport system ATPase subunit
MTMSDRIAVMSGGRIEQLDDPARIYNAPQTKFVANFVGKVNFLPGRLAEHVGDHSAVETPYARVVCPRIADASEGAAVTVAVRPERLRLLPDGVAGAGMNVVEGRIETQTFSGNLYHDLVRLADGDSLLVEIRPAERVGGPGERVRVGWNVGDTVIINEA